MKLQTHRYRIRVIASSRLEDSLLLDIARRPDDMIASGKTLKHDGTTTVAVVGDAGKRWVIKRYNTKNRWHAIRRLLRTSRAQNCWRAAGWLAAAGIETAQPVVALEERYFKIFRGRSYFVYEFVDGETLADALTRQGDNNSRCIAETCAIVRRLRDYAIVHGDMKATNFILNGDRIVLVDLDVTRRASGHRLVSGLEKDRRRFLHNWKDHPELLRQFEKCLGDP